MKQYIGALMFLIGILLTGGAIDGRANPIPWMILTIIGAGILVKSTWGSRHEDKDLFNDTH